MALTTEIITTSEIKTHAITNTNLDVAYLEQYILLAQRKYIRKFLGNDFYEEILGQVDNTATLTSDNSTLLEDYIKPCLAHYVVFESLPQIRNQISKGGVFNNLSETADVVSGGDYDRIRNDYIAKAEAFEYEIDYFIEDARDDDATKYPLYNGKNEQNTGIIIY